MPYTYIIAEIGVNHNGSLALAKQLIDEAVMAGADAAKFQSFKAAQLVAKHAPKAEYQLHTTEQSETQLQMLQKLEFSAAQFHELRDYCLARNIDFLSSPFDMESLEMLTTELPIAQVKIASGELTNAPMLRKAAQSGRPLLLSTGMSTLAEIQQALSVIAYGFLAKANDLPSLQKFATAYASEEGQRLLRERVTILHCTTEYPAPLDEVNLHVIPALAQQFGLRVGYSDHTEGIEVSVAAVALGATLIEKHFTLDRTMDGPDHRASLEPQQFKQMVQAIRKIERTLGDGVKAVTPTEAKNRAIARKSIVAAIDIRAGQLFDEHNLTMKRPGTGIAPVHYWKLLGTIADRDYAADELIDVNQLSEKE